MRLCECGCGQETTRAATTDRRYGHVKGQSLRFVNGHQVHIQTRPAAERFARFVGEPDANRCREWGGAKNWRGYGLFGIAHGKNVIAHRYAYELAHGEIPERHDIHHVCENRSCVSPEHLEAIPHGDHMRMHKRLESRSVGAAS